MRHSIIQSTTATNATTPSDLFYAFMEEGLMLSGKDIEFIKPLLSRIAKITALVLEGAEDLEFDGKHLSYTDTGGIDCIVEV